MGHLFTSWWECSAARTCSGWSTWSLIWNPLAVWPKSRRDLPVYGLVKCELDRTASVEAIPVRSVAGWPAADDCVRLALAWLIFPDLSFFEVALIATMLAPTDAAFGKAVVTNPVVPAKVRESLNVESGLNDGICVPVILFFIALAAGSVEASESASLVLKSAAESDRNRSGDRPCSGCVGRICITYVCGPGLGCWYLATDSYHRTRLALLWIRHSGWEVAASSLLL